MSGYASHPVVVDASAHVLAKPFATKELLVGVREVLDAAPDARAAAGGPAVDEPAAGVAPRPRPGVEEARARAADLIGPALIRQFAYRQLPTACGQDQGLRTHVMVSEGTRTVDLA